MPPRYSHAAPRDDGGFDFYTPDGQRRALYGPSVVAHGASLPRPPSMATSPEALAMAPTEATPGAPVASDWAPPLREPEPAPPPPATPAPAELGTINPADAERAFAGKERTPQPSTGKTTEEAVRAGLGFEVKPADGKAGSKRAVFADDVVPKQPATETEAKAQGYSSLDEAKLAFKGALEARTREAMRGGGATKARWQDTTSSTVREGRESDATAADRQAALEALGRAEAGKAEVGRGQDLADRAALEEAARRNLGTAERVGQTGADEEAVLMERAQRLRGEANQSELGFKSGALKALDDAGSRYSESSNAMLGDAILTSANGGGDVSGVLSAMQAGKRDRLGRKDRQNDEADKARQGVPQVRRAIEGIKTEAYTDYLANVLKANAAEYKAAGRLPELEATLAQLAEKKAALRGAREAAEMGTTTSGRKFVPASSGGGAANLAKALEAYGKQMADIGQVEAANEAKLAASGAKIKAPTIIVGGQRLPLDPNLPDAVKNKVYERAEAQAQAEGNLAAIQRDLEELGARRFAPDAIRALIQGPAGARLRANVQALTRNESVAEGGGALMESERKAAESEFLDALSSKGTVEAKIEKFRRNRKALARTATGSD